MLIRGREISTLILLLAIVASDRKSVGDEWPQWRGPNRDGVWSETGVIDEFESARVPLKWKVPISSGYSGPTVNDGRVYVTDRFVEPKQMERVLCVDWRRAQNSGPSATTALTWALAMWPDRERPC